MYDDWSSLSIQLGPSGTPSISVLSKLPPEEARRVVSSVVKTVASQLGLASPKDARPSPLSRETEVIWFMEVICYGLTLPLSEHETIKDCVNVYCEWLSTLLPEPKTCVPTPILEEPNKFSRRILQHLYHIFVPRKEDSGELEKGKKQLFEKSRKQDLSYTDIYLKTSITGWHFKFSILK
jgi:hypothetical protein